MTQTQSPTHSKFGGTWLDRTDFPEQLELRARSGAIDEDLRSQLEQFERDGYIVLEGAASNEDLDSFESAISKAFREGHEHLIAQQPGNPAPLPVTDKTPRHGTRIVDSFAVIPSALDLLSSPRLARFLRAVLDEKPMLFQSLSFDTGSEQGLHQDTAYVVVDRPLELAACWIALEDVQPGSGELKYLVGSHRLPDFNFGGTKKHWNPEEDGNSIHDEWSRWLVSEGERRGLPLRQFMAKRGDILIWHADLAHGGSPITSRGLTRKSLVGHFCPTSVLPNFMKFSSARSTILHRDAISYSSWHYDLAALQSSETRKAYLADMFRGEGQ
ncbi:MAG: hypothetical protein SHS37scaffold220_70 [Phage 67_12]|nr:MAG: hypothetical protein SHS37scaffold220_70 [Phage 67_12]